MSVVPRPQQWPPSIVTRQTQMLTLKEPPQEYEPRAAVSGSALASASVKWALQGPWAVAWVSLGLVLIQRPTIVRSWAHLTAGESQGSDASKHAGEVVRTHVGMEGSPGALQVENALKFSLLQ